MIAAELMTPSPLTMQPTDTVSQAVDVLDTMNIRHLPIVDDRGHLVGMLSDRDLGPLMRIFIEGAEAEEMVIPLSERRIADLMTGDVISVELDADVLEVAELMVEERVGAIPVVDEADNVRGIISYVDVLRALAPTDITLRTPE
jgi:CBS domain-containing protein